MADLDGELWRYNVAKITLVDVTDDYHTLLDPMPSDMYPVVREVFLPKHRLIERLVDESLVDGYCYDWHEAPNDAETPEEHWYVGVVNERIV